MLQKTVRWVYLAIGGVCTALGVIGAFVPVMPTTPFLLIALWAFSKSSKRLQSWLYHHPRYGTTLKNWFEHGAISARVKTVACIAMLLSVPVVYHVSGSWLAVCIHGSIIAATAVFILSRPTDSPSGP
jgi:uncharacterized membrane protein YbaN (DUF454 family)